MSEQGCIFSQKGYPYIQLPNNRIKEKGQSFPEHPTLSPFAGVHPDAGESLLLFKDFVV
jgi:hypothetical protein